MGKTFSTGLLTDGIAQDSSNNIGIGGAASGSYKLQVTGATNLTGALSGTSATFSGAVGIGGAPSTFDTIGPVLQVNRGVMYSYADGVGLAANFRYESGDIYINSNFSTLYQQSTGEHRWFTAPSGTAGSAITFTQRMTLTNSGNVGIGITAPSSRLCIQAPASANPNTGGLSFKLSNGTTYFTLGVNGTSGDGSILAGSGGGITFHTNSDMATSNERMRITNDGRFLVGATATDSGCKFRFVFDAVSQNGMQVFDSSSNTSTGIFHLFGINNGGPINIGSITRNGLSNAVNFNTTSDYRLKEDYKQINGLDKVLAIKVYDFKWKGIESRMDGVIAHELAEVLPYAVTGQKDDKEMQSVDYSKIVPILVKAIQELSTELTELKALIAAK